MELRAESEELGGPSHPPASRRALAPVDDVLLRMAEITFNSSAGLTMPQWGSSKVRFLSDMFGELAADVQHPKSTMDAFPKSETSGIRQRYVPDGNVRWERLLACSPVIFAVAIGLGWILDRVYDAGFYYFIVFPLIAGLLLNCVLYVTVRFSHCRSPVAAAGLGALSGIVALVAMLYFGMMSAVGPGGQANLLDLPSYVHFRMQNQAIGRRERGDDPKPFDFVFSYLYLGLDAVIFVIVPGFAGIAFAKHPYSTEANVWYQRSRFKIRAGVARSAIMCLMENNLDEFAQTLVIGSTKENSTLYAALFYVKVAEQSPLEFPVYLSIDEVPLTWNAEGVFQRVQITLEEAIAVRPLFPEFQKALGQTHSNLQGDAGAVVLNQPSRSPPLIAAESPITAIQPPQLATEQKRRDGGMVFTSPNRWQVACLTFIPTLWLIFSTVAGLVGAVAAASSGWTIAFVLSVLMIASGTVWQLRDLWWYARGRRGAAWAKRWVAALQQRQSSLVNPDDPDSILFGMVDIDRSIRRHRIKIKDLGLLKLDVQAGVLVLDGDYTTFTIPLQSIKECRISLLTPDVPDSFMLDMTIRTERGLQQIFLDLMLKELVACGRKCQEQRVATLWQAIVVSKGQSA